MSNIGKALEKIVSPTKSGGALSDTRVDNTSRQRRFEYEDGVITRSVEATYQIQRMAQPFLFSRDDLDKRHFMVQGDANSEPMVVLRDLRNRITMKNASLGATILVSSVSEDVEASFLSRNLAAILAADESRTSLLMECKRVDDKLYGDMDGKPAGLTGYLEADSLPIHDIVMPTGIPRMRVIPFGSGEPINYEFLRSTRMRILIKDVTRRYPRERFTIIDAPPIDLVPDVELLNEYVDHVILTVPYGKVSDLDVKNAVSKVDPAKLLGVLLTGSPRVPGAFAKLAK